MYIDAIESDYADPKNEHSSGELDPTKDHIAVLQQRLATEKKASETFHQVRYDSTVLSAYAMLLIFIDFDILYIDTYKIS